ncbi:14036_t:CDS:2 [Gigaspora rosea]|nr:14036_t:CDS:2 [Gigaspora rosea]
MDTIPQYYQTDNMSMSKEPSQLSSNFVQPELSQLQSYTPMTDTGYPSDQFGMQGPVPVSEPPPYDEFTSYNWVQVPAEIAPFFPPTSEGFQHPLLSSHEEEFIFKDFLYNIQEDPNFIFNPILPRDMPNMPPYPPQENGIDNPVHPMETSPSIVNELYNPPQNIPSEILPRHQLPPSKSTSLSPRTKNITLSPKNSPHEFRQSSSSSQLTSPIDDKDKLVTPSVPAKRKQDGKHDAGVEPRRRPSNPPLSPINTKLVMTQSHNLTSSPRPMSPSMQLSNLSINKLLTEEEKRANHIASEQKRRNTIRAGFKELTDIIPTLKNVNNSKSTILFKAVDYIKYLERRNRNLKERAGLLEMRVEMEMRQGKRYHHHGGFGPAIGFGQRVGPMPMGPGYTVMPNSLNGMNGMQIPIGQGHPPPQVIAPPMQNIYFVSTGADNQPMPSQQQILSSVNPTNNIFRGNMQIPIQQQPQQVNNDNNNNGLVPGMNIPAMAIIAHHEWNPSRVDVMFLL